MKDRVWNLALCLVVTCALTFVGLVYSWQQVEAPDPKRAALSVALLLPVAALTTLVRAFSSDGHLSQFTYRLTLILGAFGQFLYYYALLFLIRWCAVKLMRRFQSSAERRDDT
jgi:hypothetical protein